MRPVGALIGALSLVALAGCTSTGVSGSPEPGTTSGSLATSVGSSSSGTSSSAGGGTSFNPCTDLTDADITAFGLDPTTRKNSDVGLGDLARGCGWENTDVTVDIQVGDQTVAELAARSDFIEVKTLTVGGRDAVQFRTDNTGNCTVAMTSQQAAVQVNVINQLATVGIVDSCTAANDIATKLTPILPR